MAAAIVAREKAAIVYPPDGKLMGDWKNGEKLAQSGYGGRFTDYPPRQANGGNCYACHQLAKAQVSYGTLGPEPAWSTARSASSPRPRSRLFTSGSTTRTPRLRAQTCRDWVPASS